ncbi:MAG TPA: acyltransferase [Xanthobacteraceae bacterium]|jgi:peptidoglycan/LPS O-acetylase OafA/YrhL|nr:acyltransferase [Xanthobacteraceae bacterium]
MRETLYSLQILRFLAAALVMLSHVEHSLSGFRERYGAEVLIFGISGDLGVRIFFVISGFIMVYIAHDAFAKPGAPGRFLAARIVRVVPLYWLLTTLQILVFLLLARLGDPSGAALLSVPEVVKSYFFIPYFNLYAQHRPILSQGWTLNYEMFFYLAFAASLFLRRTLGLLVLVAALLGLTVAGTLDWQQDVMRAWTHPILLEFVIGIALALVKLHLVRSGRGVLLFRHAIPACLALIVAVTAFPLAVPAAHTLVAMLTVGLCVLCVDANPARPAVGIMVVLGNASYSLYLSHSFIFLFVDPLWRKLLGGHYLGFYFLLVTSTALALGYLTYRCIELPMNGFLRSALLRRSPRPAPVPR